MNIASFVSRPSLARLCSISRDIYSTFSPILYANTIDPSLAVAQSSRLTRTLSSKKTLMQPYLIRRLALTDGGQSRTDLTPYDEDNHTYPHSGLSALVSAINIIRLPVLAALNIAPDLTPEFMEEFDDLDDVPVFDTDFVPFLGAHPNLVDLTLSAEGTQLTDDVTFYLAFAHSRAPLKIPPSFVLVSVRQRRKTDITLHCTTSIHPHTDKIAHSGR
ncbi:hypothetical protein C8R47DRAFT_1214532 [Mycena vitilis]|nr:hypothetical protein C8R47DRAFT_1214532 [Mycena vitilis]